MKTVTNYFDGLFGGLLIVIGVLVFFSAPLIGIGCIVIGGFLHYKSKTYVHGVMK